MLQGCRDLDLPEEAILAQRRGEFLAQQLDGHSALVLQVLGEVDRGHTALAQLALDPVAVG
jgi:hypothetical protein